MELYVVFSVVERENAQALLDIHNELQLSVVLSNLGQGTATTEQLLLYDLEQSEKVVVSTIVTADSMKRLMKLAKRKLFIDIPGNGVMMAVPLKSVGGGRSLAYITDEQVIGGSVPDMNFEYELIVVILNEGYADFVMDAARNAGATGGTVFHAKGTGRAKTEKFYGVSLAEEKDMIYILAASGK
ncbi:MAG: P-II family nitrogen regulator [Lachnospiraceae bacterium]|nr:P-II family nitrogen regulator [Lachnospiraceae bacterium]